MDNRFDLRSLNDREKEAFCELKGMLHVEESGEADAIVLRFEKGTCPSCEKKDGEWVIFFSHESEKWRALGRALEESGDFAEKPGKDLQAMLDCSRNGVLSVDAVKRMLKHLTLMGYRGLQLYTEDTYSVEGEPYFGYQRGRYSRRELQEIDRYAALFDMEVIPCIQTLAHLERMLRWQVYDEIKDCDYILLADEEKTYALIDKMFAAMAESLSSRRINIGMDEAHALGLGRYLDRFGYQNRMDIMVRHFNCVWDIAQKYGYEPMMWSDMFFKLACGGEYYAEDISVEPEITERIPKGLTLVYWDYYTQEKEKYDRMLRNHKKLSENIAFAGGVWTWTGFFPNSSYSRHIAFPAYESCQEHGIDTILLTAWGDDGAEASCFAALPAFLQWAELIYGNGSDEAMLEKRFSTCVGGSYAAFLKLGMPILTPCNPEPGKCSVNPAKYLLYQDVLGGLFDAHVTERYAEHFEACAKELNELESNAGDYAYLFRMEKALCSLLAQKSVFGLRLRSAYRNADRKALGTLAGELPKMRRLTESFLCAFEERWMAENKVFGLDVIQIRIGGLLERMRFAEKRLQDYCCGRTEALEELEDEVLPYRNEEDMAPPFWHDIVTACNI